MAEAKNLEREARDRERERASNDVMEVYNPTREDFIQRFNQYNHLIPNQDKDIGFGNGKAHLLRYIAKLYFTHMIDKILTDEADQHILTINNIRKKRGQPELNPQEREREETPYRTDNKEKRAKWMKVLFKGIVKKHGMDVPVPEVEQASTDARPMDDVLLEQLETSEVTTTDDIITPEDVQTPGEDLEEKKKESIKEME
jgi:hypothetical protein